MSKSTAYAFATAVLASGLALAGAALAADPPAPMPHAPMGGMRGHGMPGAGMHGGMHAACPMHGLGADAESIKVENLKDGVRVTYTSSDAKAVTRLQKRAEILRLTHELEAAESNSGSRR
jgi:hypothetical protein